MFYNWTSATSFISLISSNWELCLIISCMLATLACMPSTNHVSIMHRPLISSLVNVYCIASCKITSQYTFCRSNGIKKGLFFVAAACFFRIFMWTVSIHWRAVLTWNMLWEDCYNLPGDGLWYSLLQPHSHNIYLQCIARCLVRSYVLVHSIDGTREWLVLEIAKNLWYVTEFWQNNAYFCVIYNLYYNNNVMCASELCVCVYIERAVHT